MQGQKVKLVRVIVFQTVQYVQNIDKYNDLLYLLLAEKSMGEFWYLFESLLNVEILKCFV